MFEGFHVGLTPRRSPKGRGKRSLDAFWHRPVALAVHSPHQSVRFVVAEYLFARRIEPQRTVYPASTVAQMRQRRRQMSFLDVGVRPFAFADAVEEVLMMR